MPTLKGSTSGSILSTAYNIPSTINSFSLTNDTGGALVAKVYAVSATGTSYFIYEGSIAANSSYVYVGQPILIDANFKILFVASGALSYYFSLQPL